MKVYLSAFLITIALSILPRTPAQADAPLSIETVYSIICQPKYYWPCETMVEIAYAESNFHSEVVNYDCDNSGTYRLICVGLLQVTGEDIEEAKNPFYNIQVAYRKYSERGLQPWGR